MAEALTRLDAHLCDIAELPFRDGLHVFGRSALDPVSAEAEREGCCARSTGASCRPGPAGSPHRGRPDVLPTGRNLSTLDPRAIPTRAAARLGAGGAGRDRAASAGRGRAAAPDRDGSLGLADAALGRRGHRPCAGADGRGPALGRCLDARDRLRDHAAAEARASAYRRHRAHLGRFRDTFPSQVALLDAAARAVAMLDEPTSGTSPPRPGRRGEAGARVFGAAPGRYGAAVADRALDGHWTSRDELGAAYLAASSHAYGGPEGAGHVDDSFSARIRTADAFVHVSDTAGRDILEAQAPPTSSAGSRPRRSRSAPPLALQPRQLEPGDAKARTVAEDIARIVHGRLTHPRWIASHLAHGWRGAAELAEAVDTLFVFAASTTPSPTGCSTRSSRPGAPMPRSGPRSRPPMLRPRRRSARGWRRRRGAAVDEPAQLGGAFLAGMPATREAAE